MHITSCFPRVMWKFRSALIAEKWRMFRRSDEETERHFKIVKSTQTVQFCDKTYDCAISVRIFADSSVNQKKNRRNFAVRDAQKSLSRKTICEWKCNVEE